MAGASLQGDARAELSGRLVGDKAAPVEYFGIKRTAEAQMAGNAKTLTVRISPELQGKLDLIADAIRQPRSRVVKRALEVYITAEAAQIDEIKRALAEADSGDFASEAETEAVFQKWCSDKPDDG